MAHLLACSVKMAHLWTDSCILYCMCVLACVRVFMFVCGQTATSCVVCACVRVCIVRVFMFVCG